MLGKIIHAGLQIVSTDDAPDPKAWLSQTKQLNSLLKKARNTAFGKHYQFNELLKADNVPDAFRQVVPATAYDEFYETWWRFAREDQPDVTWPGITPFYALSSGTSGASSKYIPVTKDMLKGMKKGSRRMFFDLSKYDLPEGQLRRQMLMVGSSTALSIENRHFIGDLSGIIGLNRPAWMSRYYKPGRAITDMPEWGHRIQAIVQEAPKWDIGFTVGNPAWVQMIFEQIIEKYHLNNIHDIWPNLHMYVHGGVFFEPYRLSFEQLLGKPVYYVDSYMASEGFFAYENRPGSRSMRLLTDCGVYFEFVPFNESNFDDNGNLLPAPQTLNISEIEENVNYALLISTAAGAWRYLLGDTLKFTDTSRLECRITGRTKQFLSVCGEHLSIDNLNEAVRRTDELLKAGIREFAVAGVPFGTQWAHQWYISLENNNVHPDALKEALDKALCELNDDYAVERRYALPELRVEIIPNHLFYEWLAQKGKLNGQAKIPRVMKGKTLQDWQQFIHAKITQ